MPAAAETAEMAATRLKARRLFWAGWIISTAAFVLIETAILNYVTNSLSSWPNWPLYQLILSFKLWLSNYLIPAFVWQIAPDFEPSELLRLQIGPSAVYFFVVFGVLMMGRLLRERAASLYKMIREEKERIWRDRMAGRRPPSNQDAVSTPSGIFLFLLQPEHPSLLWAAIQAVFVALIVKWVMILMGYN